MSSEDADAHGLILNAKFLTLTCKNKEIAMRITSKGQVTIPVEIREKAGLLPNTEVEFVLERGGEVRLVKAKVTTRGGRGAEALRRLRGSGTVRMSTDEIMALTRG